MSLSLELQRYLKIRRSLGYDLSTSEGVLKKFVSFLEANNQTHVTSDLFLQWKQVFGKAAPSTWAGRLGMVRLFALWLHSLDPSHEIPPQSLIPSRYRRKQPYIYTDDEIRRITETACLLPSKNGFRAITYPVFFGLVSVTGLRISEAIALNDKDADLENGVITVYNGKNGKDRILPVIRCGIIMFAALCTLCRYRHKVHSTGHESRLKRDTLMQMAEFGGETYSIEELVAEIGTCYLQSVAGITGEFQQSTAYIQGWLGKLKGDKRFIFQAARAAQKAVDFILNTKETTEEAPTE